MSKKHVHPDLADTLVWQSPEALFGEACEAGQLSNEAEHGDAAPPQLAAATPGTADDDVLAVQTEPPEPAGADVEEGHVPELSAAVLSKLQTSAQSHMQCLTPHTPTAQPAPAPPSALAAPSLPEAGTAAAADRTGSAR